MAIARRKLVWGSAAVAAAIAPWALLGSRRSEADVGASLIPDPSGLLDLAPGFTYEVLESAGATMDDGYLVPGRPDAMACFPGPHGSWILMRNHELGPENSGGPYVAGRTAPPQAYDREAIGGVTRVVLDESFHRRSSNLVLAGTARNCAGGVSPWGWLSCEESVEPGHGYVFLCRTDADGVQPPQRLDGYGRFLHEAAAIDVRTHIGYLTEDRPDGCLYRFVPERRETPFVGRLQALRVVGRDRFSTASMEAGEKVAIDWLDVEGFDPPEDTVRSEAQSKGAATFARGEGLWIAGSSIYLSATAGGPIASGQIFRLLDDDTPILEAVAVSTDTAVLNMPDNITVAPWGDLYLAEDNGTRNHVRVLDVQGRIVTFARNASGPGEFAGLCFSPDGRALFVNLQTEGLTLVIRGPFPYVS